MQTIEYPVILNNLKLNRPVLYIDTDIKNNVIVGNYSYQAIANNYSNCTIIGSYANCTGNAQVQLGSTISNTYSYANLQNISDARDKADICNTTLGLEFISQLRPVDYRWNYREDYVINTGEYQTINGIRIPITETLDNDGSKTRTRFHHGFIAQEVKQVMDTMGIDFGGYQDHTINGGQDKLSLSYTELIAPMIKAIQELKIEVNMLKAQVETLQHQVQP